MDDESNRRGSEKKKKENPTPSLFPPEFWAKSWGVSTAYIYKLVREKKIEFFHLGKSIRISARQAEDFLKTSLNGEYHRDRLKRKENGRERENGVDGIAG